MGVKVFECMHRYSGSASIGNDDQCALTECLFGEARDLIAIDYSGSLVLTNGGMQYERILQGTGGRVLNRVTGLTQCFAHFNLPDPFPTQFVAELAAKR